MKLTLTLTGTKPMLQHNGRLANPLDPYTVELGGLTSKRKKTNDDLHRILVVESRGACYETEEGLLGVPTPNVWRCIYDAAKAFKLGEDVKRSVSFEDVTEPLLVKGEPITCDKFLEDPEHIDYRPVKVSGRKTMRARPLVPTGWQTTHTLTVLDDVMRMSDLGPVLDRAGRLGGLGDWRPTYGTFEYQAEEQ